MKRTYAKKTYRYCFDGNCPQFSQCKSLICLINLGTIYNRVRQSAHIHINTVKCARQNTLVTLYDFI